MKSIWYFVGLILLIIGIIVLETGIYSVIFPPESKKALSSAYPELWWGQIMIIVGALYIWKNKNKVVE